MSTKKPEQSAYPHAEIHDSFSNLGSPQRHLVASTGMTLHQHYAGLAMQAMVSSIHNEEGFDRFRAHARAEGLSVSQWIARDSFKQADAMVAASEGQSELERVTAERDELARGVLEWWEEHQYDTVSDGQESRNLYDEEPGFVTAAIDTGVQI